MRKAVIVGNWKMNTDLAGATSLAKELTQLLSDISEAEVGICPPFCFLHPIAKILEGTKINLGAQAVFYEESGAFTGEVSAAMLASIPVKYVIIGHSERRQIFGETDEIVNKKLIAVLKNKLTPIVCCGETLEEREENKAKEVIKKQITSGFANISTDDIIKCIIAYEPIWAIGTGKTASPETAAETHKFIRNIISDKFGKESAERIRIQYGGSVKPENIDMLMAEEEIDGALVGGASLTSKSFERIVRFKKLTV
ncbi:MAG: triose-phosphate isomerase [Planctomycetota bacterium]